DCPWSASKKTNRILYRSHKIFFLLAQRSLGIGILTGTQDSHKELYFPDFARILIDYRKCLSCIIHIHFITGLVVHVHHRIYPIAPVPEVVPELGAFQAIGIFFIIFLPEMLYRYTNFLEVAFHFRK